MANMMLLPGYEVFEKIGDGLSTNLFRGRRLGDHQPVIMKVLKAKVPLLTDVAQLQREYEIAHRLNIEGILRPVAMEQFDHLPTLIMEDFEGRTLRNFANKFDRDPVTFLQIAIQLSDTVEEIHQNNLIHNHLNPDNILCSLDTKKVKITGFGGASRLSGEKLPAAKERMREGMLAYLSPEQTGRMNRMLDYRTDFYSMGVIFYELLTGQLPFTFIDPLELVHAHIAKQPKQPCELNPRIPIPVANIVMKLLAKMAEDRYQSAYGLKTDLEFCLTQLHANGEIQKFSLGQNDVTNRFQVSQKLYGRQKETGIMLEAFEHAGQGKDALILVAGYSGIGKSTLVDEVQKPIAERGGLFISGKFDQLHSDIPYSALIQAIQGLIQQILSDSEENIKRWRENLQQALGQIGQVVIDVIPEVALITGPQPSVPRLAPTESQNRFRLVFKHFIQIFASQERPLVIFLDDLQWAGAATMTLIQDIVSDLELHHLLLIGSYRDNEILADHPVALTIKELEKAGIGFSQLKIHPLALDDVNQWIADTLHCDPEESLPFAQLVLQKTNGNPFFVSQLLQSLYQEGLFHFDLYLRKWRWDLKQIEAVEFTDNVVDLMIQKLQKLPTSAQGCAKLAACLGNRFDLKTLSTICEEMPADAADNLWPVAQAGLIQRVGEWSLDHVRSGFSDNNKGEAPNPIYRFLHDRVQQAAYELIPVDQRQTTHLKIGRLLFRGIEPDELEEKVFELVNHFNTGAALITDIQEQIQLAELNLLAGKKAQSAAAHEDALNYLSAGIQLLPDPSWQRNYDLTLALYTEAAEAAFMNTDFDRSEAYAKIVLEQAKTILDKVNIFELQMQAYISQNQMVKAVDIGLKVLDMLGVPLKTDLRDEDLVLPQIEELAHLPVMRDPEHLAALRILVALAPPAFQTRPENFPHIIRTQIYYSMIHGLSAMAAVSYGLYGFLLLSGPREDIAAGYRSGQIALKLLEIFKVQDLKCKVLFIFNGHIRHWKDHAKMTLEPFREGILSGLESGDLQFVGYNAKDLCSHMFFMGKSLREVAAQMSDMVSLLKNLKQEHSTYYIQIWQQVVSNLQDQGNSRSLLSGPVLDAQALIPSFQQTNNRNLLFITYLAEEILHYLFQQYEEAVLKAEKAAEHEESSAGLMNIGPYNYYSSLSLLALFPKVSPREQKNILIEVEENQRRMLGWAGENYKHAYQLVEAEKARALGHIERAMAFYDEAITSAIRNGFTNIEAIANERAGIFYLSLGREKIAQLYLQEAYVSYLRWGATAKAKDLEQNHALLISTHPVENGPFITQSGLTQGTGTPAEFTDEVSLDLAAVLKSSQAISSEIVLERLLANLLKIVIENAGAEKAFLLLEQGGELHIQASGMVDGEIIAINQEAAVPTDELLSTMVVNYVRRLRENLVISDAANDPRFGNCAYIGRNKPKSLLCIPILHHNSMMGILYLENNLTTYAFTPERIETLQILASQAAISLENARLYGEINREAQIRHRAEEILRTITEGTAAVIGKDFFRSLLHHLSSTFNVREAFITECTDQSRQRVRMVALLRDSKFQERFEYKLAGTPCERVIKGEVSYYPRNLEQLFPAKKGMESYLGAPLFDGSGEVLGHLAVIDDKPLDLDPQARAVFEIFASRAGVELERKRSEEALRRSEQTLRRLNEKLEDYSRNLENKVTERTQEIERRRKVAESLRGILAILNSNRSRNEIMNYIVSEARQLLASSTSAIYRLDHQDNHFQLQSAHGHSASQLNKEGFPVELGEAVKSGQPVAISNLDAKPGGSLSLLAVPLFVSGEFYGCLALYYSEARLFSQEEISLAAAFGDQAALAIENDRLRNLVKQAAVKEERGRLARELHDSVTQSLFSLTLLAEGWQRLSRSGKMENVAESLTELGEIAQQALKEMRLLVYELRPPTLEQEGLLGALHQRLNAVERRAGVEAHLMADDLFELPDPIEEGLYRITQEALNNSLKHSGATSVTVSLGMDNGFMVLEVADNGHGFDLQSDANVRGGMGLSSMRERAERLGGSLEIRSTVGEGTTVLVQIPAMEVSHEGSHTNFNRR
jgi:predicted ATPase/signal transduction histidine kinase